METIAVIVISNLDNFNTVKAIVIVIVIARGRHCRRGHSTAEPSKST
eukprot:CAMPEP_0201929366 /NCGR_PEP_ID=MMETSP0903-20130614/22891_1 /ASSEMBLY_ACC=CAM_ASM_000552 /TAXON_ID=420261 /ORGANISM="Thalassiosira antarctica, Strain CCMP982" /LENGTH=46 /DNA_ID= /DNA_START= /DNA_END= /DNA_ORIENTATION=